ncbi:MAG: ATP synthase F1 subunit epsilon [Oscillospiraceae bacterium]|nr:ATP synthase F1 subunit epsilon [Oscillospiraceae bacterium]MBQ1730018.1 ATP synthase F1 subunit epsilon [Oscillospiraceae bacterium]MBQ1768626.1 ATP synthase F1 subunit epsilon [Oscillospiraceae bacterium]MBQ2057726.1 ATP synthase F1 subunit epsilon [Oscillospiraceae bacterium]MBQ2157626.1 ATP synthase F1 subunit epsilon [Oscillospiraceae bacterium]
MANTFKLRIATLDGQIFDGEAEKLLVRTIDGDVCILPGHISYVTALGMGEARVYVNGEIKRAACIGGLLTVSKDEVRLVPTTFEWAENIDLERAERARAAAEQALKERADRSNYEITAAEARLKRALVRSSVAKYL